MSLEQLGDKEFARRNLWEATLFDENHKPLEWSTGLIKSINTPKLSFTVEDIFAGASKGYTGWKLPDNLSISIWETSDHIVERYLDSWMLGKNGVFNIEKGTFRVQPSEDYLYRDVRVKTFIYEYTESTPYKVKKQNVISELALHMKNGLQKISGKVTIEQQENIKKISELAVSEVESILANQNSSVFVTQQTAPQKIIAVSRKQVIPVLDKVAAAVSSLVNQAVTRIPLAESDITRKIIPPVVIPPPLLHVPVPTGSPILQPPMINGKIVALQKNVKPSTQEAFVKILPGPGKVNTSQKVQLTIAPGVESNIQTINEYTKKAEEVLVEFASGEAYNAKQWKASEKLTSAITYSTAIEGYDIGTYDYTTGDGVSYTINLAVRDIQIDFSINSSARNQPWDVYSRMK